MQIAIPVPGPGRAGPGRVSILTELIRVQSLFFARHKKPSIRGQASPVLPRYEQYPVHANGCARRRPLLVDRPMRARSREREREIPFGNWTERTVGSI